MTMTLRDIINKLLRRQTSSASTAREMPRLAVRVVFPTPPFPEQIRMTRVSVSTDLLEFDKL